MNICMDLFWESDFGQVFRRSVSANGKVTDNILTEKQKTNGFFLSFYVNSVFWQIYQSFSEDLFFTSLD